MGERPTVGITMGDPAGIGAEVIALGYADLLEHANVVVIGDADVLGAAIEACGQPLTVRAVESVADARRSPEVIDVIDLGNVDDLERGVVREAYGRASLEYVEAAIDLAVSGKIDAITTAPIHKRATRLAGAEHAGHTGLLADRTGTDRYSMMLIEEPLRVTHVSTHVPLRTAIDRVTADAVHDVITLTNDALHELEVGDPRIAVAGVNPHAGEQGVIGEEDAAEIEPAVDRARDDGVDVFGPEPPDTVFARAAGGAADCVVAMYHDQGHIPIKMLGFDGGVSGVNMTIGLPIVRTSVDHGTAFDIAGECVADPTSLIDAVRIAADVARNRQSS